MEQNGDILSLWGIGRALKAGFTHLKMYCTDNTSVETPEHNLNITGGILYIQF